MKFLKHFTGFCYFCQFAKLTCWSPVSGHCSCCQFYTCQGWQVGRSSHCFCTFWDGKTWNDKTNREKEHEKGDVCDLPDDLWVRPAADGAVQAHALLLPHGVGTGFDHKLWGVHQAVYVHALKVLLVFMDLERETPKSQRTVKNSVKMNFFREWRYRIGNSTEQSPTCLHWPCTCRCTILMGLSGCCSFEYLGWRSGPAICASVKSEQDSKSSGISLNRLSRNTISRGISHPPTLCGREYYSTRITVALIILI